MPSLPEVDSTPDFAEVVRKARAILEPGAEVPEQPSGQRHVAVITPGRMVMLFPVPPGPPPPELVASVRRIVPEERPLHVTVVARTDAVRQGAMDVGSLERLIPFTGFLLGLAYLGHNVVGFEGHPTAFEAGCRDADLLIIDEPVADLVQPDWVQVAGRVMRRPRILLFLRNGDIGLVNLDSQRGSAPRTQPEPEPKAKRPWWWPF